MVCLSYFRHLDFHDSLLCVVETSFFNGPISFNCFPNFMVFLTKILDVLSNDKCFPRKGSLKILEVRTLEIPFSVKSSGYEDCPKIHVTKIEILDSSIE